MSCCRRLSLLLVFMSSSLLVACGGSGSDSASHNAEEQRPSQGTQLTEMEGSGLITATVQPSVGGRAEPARQQVEAGERAQFQFIAEPGYRLLTASGCEGSLEGDRYQTAPLQADCEIRLQFEPLAELSGALYSAPETAVDKTLNDSRAAQGENGACATAQPLEQGMELHGFASAAPTGGDANRERFAEQSNRRDFYRVTQNPAHIAELEFSDSDKGADLGLYLWSADCSEQLAAAPATDKGLRMLSLMDGDGVLEVRAQAGQARYVMRVTNAWESEQSVEALASVSESIPELVPGEVILTLEPLSQQPELQSRLFGLLSAALDRAQGSQLRFKHEDASRETLARVEDYLAQVHPALPAALEKLQQAQRSEAFEVFSTLRIIDFLARQPGVLSAEPNYRVQAQRVPNDVYYGDQWHYHQIELPQAWDTTVGEPVDGSEVVVAVVDSGIYLGHEDLRDRLVPGWDFYDDDANPDDHNAQGQSSWHGTHVAGTIAASTNNLGGVAGISWGAEIMPVRVLGDDGGTRYDIIQGVRFAAGLPNDSGRLPERPADIINLSLGGSSYSKAEQQLFRDITDAGILVVAAAGNEASNREFYPAAYEQVFSVAATNCAKQRASYSNYGSSISLAAPGGDGNRCGYLRTGRILSTIGNGSDDSRLSAYGVSVGTSMASPHVAGVMALMRALHPGLRSADFQALLEAGSLTDDLGQVGRDDLFGHGLINARKAVEAARSLAQAKEHQAARLLATPAMLDLGRLSEANVELSSEGGGQTARVLSVATEAAWLQVLADGTDQNGLGRYRVSVDRSQFAENAAGNFHSDIIFHLDDASELRVPVYIREGFAAETAPVYVMLADPQTRRARYSTIAQRDSSGELHFQLRDVAAGSYLLVAGSDIDVDGYLCQLAELCGAYPYMGANQIIKLRSGERAVLNFEVDVLSRVRSFDAEVSAFATEAP